MCGWQVKLCDPLVTRGPYLSALETGLTIKCYRNSPFLLLLFTFIISLLPNIYKYTSSGHTAGKVDNHLTRLSEIMSRQLVETQ